MAAEHCHAGTGVAAGRVFGAQMIWFAAREWALDGLRVSGLVALPAHGEPVEPYSVIALSPFVSQKATCGRSPFQSPDTSYLPGWLLTSAALGEVTLPPATFVF